MDGFWSVGLRRTEIYSCCLFAQYCCVLEGFTASGKQAAATADFDTPCIFRRRLKILDRANAHAGSSSVAGRRRVWAWHGTAAAVTSHDYCGI
jgi:hypothetical protein